MPSSWHFPRRCINGNDYVGLPYAFRDDGVSEVRGVMLSRNDPPTWQREFGVKTKPPEAMRFPKFAAGCGFFEKRIPSWPQSRQPAGRNHRTAESDRLLEQVRKCMSLLRHNGRSSRITHHARARRGFGSNAHFIEATRDTEEFSALRASPRPARRRQFESGTDLGKTDVRPYRTRACYP